MKNYTVDLFKDLIDDLDQQISEDNEEIKVPEQNTHRQFLRYKINLKTLKADLLRINMLIYLKCMSGAAFIKLILRKMHYIKQIFLLEVE